LAYPFTSEIWRDLAARRRNLSVRRTASVRSGERWHYSTSTDVSAKFVEVVSGKSSRIISGQHLCPLKMDDTSYNVPEAKGPRRRATAARRRAHGRRHRTAKAAARAHHSGADRRGGPASTADDYGRFVRMLLNGAGRGAGCKAETVALMG
jgi:CubicO group peptidase (beta-lactamase class C family)